MFASFEGKSWNSAAKKTCKVAGEQQNKSAAEEDDGGRNRALARLLTEHVLYDGGSGLVW